MNHRKLVAIAAATIAAAVLFLAAAQGVLATGQSQNSAVSPRTKKVVKKPMSGVMTAAEIKKMRVTTAMRKAAAKKRAAARKADIVGSLRTRINSLVTGSSLTPSATPDYFGTTPNYANSPLPSVVGSSVTGGIRKFVDTLPGLGAGGANNLGQYIPVATADTSTYPGSDYYVIALVRYQEQLHSDLPPTTLQGYVQLNASGTATLTPPSYLGPAIVATSNRPVRVKFINKLPTGTGGNLFLPNDTTVMGAGKGPDGSHNYAENRATLHLHGGNTPWISDGTPHQWTTPAGESTPWPKGVSVRDVPDMTPSGPGEMTFYYTNQQSARLMFYHDHSWGITRLNVYGGEAAPYVLTDSTEQTLLSGGTIGTATVAAGTIPTEQVPLVIQDRTFVPDDTQLAAQDPTWNKAKWGGLGNLWYPHVYMPNQLPSDSDGVNPVGRWDYAYWTYPPLEGIMHAPVANPLAGNPGQPAVNPGTPTPCIAPEAFMDTPIVNGTAYPYVKVGRKAYRFRILNASNDRFLNLQLYYAKSNTPASTDTSGNPTLQTDSGEVPMVSAAPSTIPTWPTTWPKDGRDGGVPDPNAVGPSWVQIGTEGGFLPSATVIANQPVNYEYNRRTILFANVSSHSLLLGPAERADVVVDFSGIPDGTKLIMYNDAPAPMPGFDSRYDYYTGDPDQTEIGGAPSTLPGYGPNTRTIMQFDVSSPDATPFDFGALQAGLQAAYGASMDKPIVPEAAYNKPFNKAYTNKYAKILDKSLTFTPDGTSTPVTMTFRNKAIIEGFDMEYGRMNAQLGVGLPNVGPAGGAAINYGYVDEPNAGDVITDTIPGTPIGSLKDGTQLWLIEHQGVDTHPIHFHLFDVQVVNRVAIDGTILPPDGNELGWKDTVRMNPGTNMIVALRPTHQTLPWKLPESVRAINPAIPVGATFSDAMGNIATNKLYNFGWEYVWHCHILGHEENDMMRSIVFKVAPAAPSNVGMTLSPIPQAMKVNLSWINNARSPLSATSFTVQRSTSPTFSSAVVTFTAPATALTYVDTTAVRGVTYYYRVRAENAASYSSWSSAANSAIGLTIGRSPSSVKLGGTATLSGRLTPAAGGASVGVYVKKPGAKSYAYSSGRISGPTGVWLYYYKPAARGTYYFYARYGTKNSSVVSLTVK